MKVVPDDRLHQRFFGNEHIDEVLVALKQRLYLCIPLGREEDRNNADVAFEHPAYDFVSFGNENALLLMFEGAFQCSVRFERRNSERRGMAY